MTIGHESIPVFFVLLSFLFDSSIAFPLVIAAHVKMV